MKLQHCTPTFSSASSLQSSITNAGDRIYVTEGAVLKKPFGCHCVSKHQRWACKRPNEKRIFSSRWLGFGDNWPPYQKREKVLHLVRLDSTDDSVTVNGTPQTSSTSEVQETRTMLGHSLPGEDLGVGLIQSLHDAARTIELGVIEHSYSLKTSWISKAWLGVDRNAWVKTLSYQVAVHSMLQAAIDMCSGGDGKDRDLSMFIQKSLLRLSAPLESVIREELSAKQPGAHDWFWSHQHPMLVTSFLNLFESGPCLNNTTIWKGVSSDIGNVGDLSRLKLALSLITAIIRLGPAKISCTQFFSMVPDITGNLMDMLVDHVPIPQAYTLIKEIDLQREFLLHFGPRAAKYRGSNEQGAEEIAFWVDLLQKQLQKAMDRERIWSRLTTCESIEVLEKDLAIFGFFIALGRSTQALLTSNGFSMDHSIESLIRYFIGGSVLYYPQLSSISSYQLYVEVVCEELEWLPFYGTMIVSDKLAHGNKAQTEGLSHSEVVLKILDVCSHWTRSFIKYSSWLEDPSNIKATRFLSLGHTKLNECQKKLIAGKNEVRESFVKSKVDKARSGSEMYSTMDEELQTFDKALESVEEAINRLELLLQELHLSNSSTGKEHLKAACSDLEKIRKLKKEAEFLEASFSAKAASLEEDNDDFSVDERRQYPNGKFEKASGTGDGKSLNSNRGGLWSLLQQSNIKMEHNPSTEDGNLKEVSTSGNQGNDCELSEIHRFEVLRSELIELEKRVQRSNDGLRIDEECGNLANRDATVLASQKLAQIPKEENIIAKSMGKLKETSMDVWQGTQLLAIDTVAATVLIRRSLTGDELAEKEKQALRRTFTDLASVVPIGILMLLPVTAVGHAAMLAAIQRYAPSLIPSTYAPERLSLLRQLEKVKEMESSDLKTDENEPQSA